MIAYNKLIIIRIVNRGTGQNPLSGQNPPPAKKTLGQKPPSGQNPPPAKIPLWPKPPLRQKAPSGKKNILSTPLLSILPLLSNEYYESYKPTTLINCKLPNLLLLYR